MYGLLRQQRAREREKQKSSCAVRCGALHKQAKFKRRAASAKLADLEY
jgi:hypothetical protein